MKPAHFSVKHFRLPIYGRPILLIACTVSNGNLTEWSTDLFYVQLARRKATKPLNFGITWHYGWFTIFGEMVASIMHEGPVVVLRTKTMKGPRTSLAKYFMISCWVNRKRRLVPYAARVIRERKQIATASATRTPPNKNFIEQNKSPARAV